MVTRQLPRLRSFLLTLAVTAAPATAFVACANIQQAGSADAAAIGALGEPIGTIWGRPVSSSRYDASLRARLAAANSPIPEPVLARLKVSLAQAIIDDELVEEAARRRGIRVGDDSVASAIEAFAATFPSDKTFKAYVSQLPGGEAALRTTTRQLLLREALAGVREDEAVPLDQALKLYEEMAPTAFRAPAHVEALEILVKLPSRGLPDDLTERRKKAEEALAAVQDPGSSFAAIAQKYSEGGTAATGGDMGFVTAEAVDSETWSALMRLDPGGISPVVQTRGGFRILKLIRRFPARNVAFEAARPSVERAIRAQRRSAAIADLTKQLRTEAGAENAVASRLGRELRPDHDSGSPSFLPTPPGEPAALGKIGRTP